MKNKWKMLILAMLLVLIVAIAGIFLHKKEMGSVKGTETNTLGLNLNANTQPVSVGDIFLVDLKPMSDTSSGTPNVAELAIVFDYNKLELLDIIVPDTSLYLLETINNETGRASIDVAKSGGDYYHQSETMVSFQFRVKQVSASVVSVDEMNTTVGSPNQYSHDQSVANLQIDFSNDETDNSPIAHPVYRFLNRKTKFHFYTASEREKDNVIANLSSEWQYEGVVFRTYTQKTAGNVRVYRFLNKKTKLHFYTASEKEKDFVIKNLSQDWQYEGPVYYSYDGANKKPLYRFLHIEQKLHFYTASKNERDNLIKNFSNTWKYEGPVYDVK